MKLISTSILSANLSILGEEVSAVEVAGADLIHIDVMDGVFVPNITFGFPVIESISRSTSLPIDVHLMIQSPEIYIKKFAAVGAKSICVHEEACKHIHRTIELIKNKNIKAGVALIPSTPLEQIKWILEDVDFILIMGVNPGFGGQKFIESMLNKIYDLKSIISKRGLKTYIEVDGGVNFRTISKISRAGGNIFVAGSAVFKTDNYTKSITCLRSEI